MSTTSSNDTYVRLYLHKEYTIIRMVSACLVAAVGFVFNCVTAVAIGYYERPLNIQNRLVLNLCINNVIFCGYFLPLITYDLYTDVHNKWGVFCQIQGFLYIFSNCNILLAYLHITDILLLFSPRRKELIQHTGHSVPICAYQASWLP